MWVVFRCVLVVCASVCVAQDRTPAPQKIIDDYLRAAGGAKTLSQVRTQTLAGNLNEQATSKAGSWSVIAKAPDRLYTEIVAGGDHTVEAYNGMSPWGEDPEQGRHTLSGEAAERTETTAREWSERFADVKKSKVNLRFVGTENVGGRGAWHVQAVQGTGTPRELYFDTGTHLIIRETLPGEELDFDDYRTVNGIQTPYLIMLRRGGHEYRLTVTRAEFNTPLEDSVFSYPHAPNAPVPDIATLIHEATQNQKAIDELQKQYTCHVTEEAQAADSKGRVKSKSILEFEVFNIAGEEVRRLVARDGKPLDGDEKKKADDRFNQRFQKLTKQAPAPRDPRKGAKEQEKEDAQISDFLRAVSFTNARRERFRGTDVLAVDFGPNPAYKPKKTVENIVHQMSGVVWIDEQARDIARLEAHFTAGVKIGAGLVGSVEKGTSIVFEQARINDEVWMPTYAEIHLGGRFLLFKLRANVTQRYTDYRKFHADATLIPEQN
jgi:hypothetical protein